MKIEKININENLEFKKEMVQELGNIYTISLGSEEYNFKFDSLKDFLNFLTVSKKITSIYYKNKENDRFYAETWNDDGKIFKELKLDDSLIYDTTYLSDKGVNEILKDNPLGVYALFLNNFVSKEIKPEYFDEIKETIIQEYAFEVKKLYSRYKLILKKIFENYDFRYFYHDYKNYVYENKKNLIIKLAKNFFNSISNEALLKANIFSLVLLNYLLDNGYKIKDIQDIRVISDNYSSNVEFAHLKNLLPKNVEVNFFDENFDRKIRKLKFDLFGNKVNIIGITSNKKKIQVGEIVLPDYYKDILVQSRK